MTAVASLHIDMHSVKENVSVQLHDRLPSPFLSSATADPVSFFAYASFLAGPNSGSASVG